MEEQNKTLQIKLQSTHEKDDLIKLLQNDMEQLNNEKFVFIIIIYFNWLSNYNFNLGIHYKRIINI